MKNSRRRRLNNYRKLRKSSGSIELYHQRIPRENFEALSIEERYCFLLLGHIHDEISWLQRMSFIASRSYPTGHNLEKSGNLMQVTFLARLLLGKLFEFKQVMDANKLIPTFIADYFRPDEKVAGEERVKVLLNFYEKEEWIRTARNKHFLHYPKLADVIDTLNDPEILWYPEIVHGKKSSNTFYPASDFMANYAWFKLADSKEPLKGFDSALGTIRELALLTLQTLEQAIGYFIDMRLLKLSDNEKIKLRADSIYEARLNYFLRT